MKQLPVCSICCGVVGRCVLCVGMTPPHPTPPCPLHTPPPCPHQLLFRAVLGDLCEAKERGAEGVGGGAGRGRGSLPFHHNPTRRAWGFRKHLPLPAAQLGCTRHSVGATPHHAPLRPHHASPRSAPPCLAQLRRAAPRPFVQAMRIDSCCSPARIERPVSRAAEQPPASRHGLWLIPARSGRERKREILTFRINESRRPGRILVRSDQLFLFFVAGTFGED